MPVAYLPMPRVGFISLGCPKNLVDSEVMLGHLRAGGYEITPRAEEAEVLVVNTCSFIARAQEESVAAIMEMAELKRTGLARRLIVTGCLVERYGSEIRNQIPEVDALIGTNDVERILEAVRGELNTHTITTARLPEYLYHDRTPRMLATPRHMAYVKIIEGCNHSCTFCIIPQLRGRFRSRQPESVIREARSLARAGVRELILVGQDTTAYGTDLGTGARLSDLLERLAEIDGLAWIRFLYCYPNCITTQLLETIASKPKLVRYLDMPLQHASRRILARMRRGSHGEAFLKLLERIRRTIPGVTLRTTLIVGFPGETEADFRELCHFVCAAEFDWLGVFEYSDEDTAASHALEGKVDPETISRRREALMALQRKISARRLRKRIGERTTLLVDGPSRDSEWLWEGRLPGMAPDIDGKVYLAEFPQDEAPQPGRMARVHIRQASDYDLVAHVEEFLDAARPAVSAANAVGGVLPVLR